MISLKEYDGIANEMKHQIEVLEKQNQRSTQQIRKLMEKVRISFSLLLHYLIFKILILWVSGMFFIPLEF